MKPCTLHVVSVSAVVIVSLLNGVLESKMNVNNIVIHCLSRLLMTTSIYLCSVLLLWKICMLQFGHLTECAIQVSSFLILSADLFLLRKWRMRFASLIPARKMFKIGSSVFVQQLIIN